MFRDLIKYVKKRWYILLICFFAFTAVECGFFLYNKQDQIENEAQVQVDGYRLLRIVTEDNPYTIPDYSEVWHRATLLSEFADFCSENYDMKKLCSEWDNLLMKDKVDWITSNLEEYTIPETKLYEIRLYRVENESVVDEIEELVNEILDGYVSYIGNSMKYVDDNVSVEIEKEKVNIRDEYGKAAAKSNTSQYVILFVVTGFVSALLVVIFMYVLFDKKTGEVS